MYIYWEGRNKILFTDDMITYVKNSKELIIKNKNSWMIATLKDTRLIYKSQFFSYILAISKWNLIING